MKELPSEKKTILIHILICLAAAGCVFGKAFFYALSLEDIMFLNWGIIHDVRNFLRFWTAIVGPSVETFSYTPVKTAVLSVLFQGFGFQSFFYHGVGLIVHGLGIVAAYKIARFFLKDLTAVLCASLLFAVYPLHIAGIVSAVGLTDMAGLVLMMWALYDYLLQRDNPKKTAFVRVYVLAGLAIFMTEAALVFPLLLLGHELIGRKGSRRMKPVLIAGLTALTYLAGKCLFVISEDQAVLSFAPLSAFFNGLISVIGIGYPQEISGAFLLGAVGCLAFLLCGIFLFADEGENGSVVMKTVGAWMILSVLPLLLIGNFPVYIAGRYLYFSSFCWCLLFSSLILMITKRLLNNPVAKKAGVCVLGMFLVFYGAVAFYNISSLRSPTTFYERLIEIYPQRREMRMDLARSCLAEGDALRAEALYAELLQDDPDNAEIYFMMEKALSISGRYEEALQALQRAVELKKDFAEAYYNLAGLSTYLGREDDARRYMETALRLWQRQGKIFEAGQALDAFEGFIVSRAASKKGITGSASPNPSYP